MKDREEIDVSIGFFTMEGQFLFACRSSVIGKEIKINKKRPIVCCHIPKLSLKEGRYYCNIIAYQKGQAEHPLF